MVLFICIKRWCFFLFDSLEFINSTHTSWHHILDFLIQSNFTQARRKGGQKFLRIPQTAMPENGDSSPAAKDYTSCTGQN